MLHSNSVIYGPKLRNRRHPTCKEEEPSSKKKKMSGKGKGKGERQRRASEDDHKAEILTFIRALSPENKERLSLAIENRDGAEVNSIFDRLN
jgi:alpha-galactosidase/6-phospho-beta-glucosidase family protein